MSIRRRQTMMILAAVAGALVVLLTGVRLSSVRPLEAQLRDLERQSDQLLQAAVESEQLRKRFPAQADIASFVETLSLLARQTGLRNLSVATLPPTRSTGAKPTASLLIFHPVKVSFEGDFRSVAEYLRRIQDLERFKRIVQIEMKPLKQTIATDLVIEITAFEGNDAA